MIKKKPTKKHAKKKAVKKVSGVHKDTKSHNVKINVLSGINKTKDKLLNDLYTYYGNWQSSLLKASKKADKNIIKKRLSEIKKEITKLKK